MKIKHEGINVHRLKGNPLEAKFAEAWKKEADRGLLGLLLCTCHHRNHEHRYSQRDATVAATIVQWLGSPVGEYFVRQVLGIKGE